MASVCPLMGAMCSIERFLNAGPGGQLTCRGFLTSKTTDQNQTHDLLSGGDTFLPALCLPRNIITSIFISTDILSPKSILSVN